MPRRKIAMRLMENPRARAATYAKRTKGLEKKAKELSMLCGVPVALVCAPAPGAGAGTRLVWESEEGVLDRYRAAAIPPEKRAGHTHRGYLEAELGKERAKLARAQQGACPGALADWDAAFNDMTVDKGREVLENIDSALRAAGDRMVALGLPADGEQVALAPDDDASDDAGVPQQLGLENMEYADFNMQMVPCNGGNNDGDLLEQFLWDDSFQMQPGCGLECVGDNYNVSAVNEMQAPAGYGDNAGCSWPDLTMCYANDRSRDAVLPAAGYYYPDFADGALAPEHYSAQVVTGVQYPMGVHQSFTNLDCTAQWPADEFQLSDTNSSMDENCTYLDNSYVAQWQAEEFQGSNTNSSMDENYTYLDNNSYAAQWQAEEFQRSDTNSSMDENYNYLDNSYVAHWQAEEFQRSDTGTGQYQYQCSDPGTHSSSQDQVFHHLY